MGVSTMKQKPADILKEFFIPLFLQIVLVVVAIIPHRLFIHRGDFVMETFMAGDEVSSPTAGRCAYLFVAFILFVIFAVLASKTANKGKIEAPFYLGIFSGTFLWQFIGEDIWHFGIHVGDEVVYFLRMETVQVLPLVIPVLMLITYAIIKGTFDWGILNVIASFLVNWLGHYVSHGTYPLVAKTVSEQMWAKHIGIIVGTFLIVASIIFGVWKAKEKRQRMHASMITYLGVGVIAFAFI